MDLRFRHDRLNFIQDFFQQVPSRCWTGCFKVAHDQERQRMNPERVGQIINFVQGRAFESALKAADVSAARNETKVFLRQALRIAGSFQASREVIPKLMGGIHPTGLIRHETHRTTIYRTHFNTRSQNVVTPRLQRAL